jgi:WD40 repeat protein
MTLVHAAALLAISSSLYAADPPHQMSKDKETGPISYYRTIRPILQQHCQGCHQPARAKGSYIMTNHAALFGKGDSMQLGVVPGHPEKSKLIEQIIPQKGKRPEMPKGQDPLLDRDVNLIKQWIAEGAKDDTPITVRDVIDAAHPPSYPPLPVITALDYSPDGKLLAIPGYHEVLLYQAEGQSLVGRLIGLSERIQSVAFSPDGKSLAVTGGDPCRFGEVQVWDVPRQQLKLSVPVTFDTLYGASWSPDGTKLAFGCADNTLRAIDVKTGKQILYQGAHSDWVLETVFSTDASHLVSVSRDMSMKLTEVATQRFVDNITSITPGALKGGLQTVARHPKKNELLIGGSDGVPKIYKMYRTQKRVIGDDFNKLREFEPMPGRIYKARFSSDGSRIAVCSTYYDDKENRGEIRTYQVADGKRLCAFAGQYGPVYALAYRPDGKEVASAGFDGLVRFNDPTIGRLIRKFVPFPQTPTQVTAASKP